MAPETSAWTAFIAAVAIAGASFVLRSNAIEPTTFPATPLQPVAPSLDALSRETQAVYCAVRPCIVHFDFPVVVRAEKYPVPRVRDEQLTEWLESLTPEARGLIESMEARSVVTKESPLQTAISPATQPALTVTIPSTTTFTLTPTPPNPSTAPASVWSPRAYLRQMPGGGRGADALVMALPAGMERGGTIERTAALVLDGRGYIVLPVAVDATAMRDVKYSVIGADGKSTPAVFVGSDQKTGLSVFRAESLGGAAMPAIGEKPVSGSLAVLIGEGGESAKLIVWTPGQREAGIVVNTGGAVCGFARPGQFLGIEAVQPIVEQIIQFGRVKRAILGVVIAQFQSDSGDAVIRVDSVAPNSVAAAAGIRAGDLILSVAGEKVSDVPAFAATIARRDGQTALELLRDDKLISVTVELRAR